MYKVKMQREPNKFTNPFEADQLHDPQLLKDQQDQGEAPREAKFAGRYFTLGNIRACGSKHQTYDDVDPQIEISVDQAIKQGCWARSVAFMQYYKISGFEADPQKLANWQRVDRNFIADQVRKLRMLKRANIEPDERGYKDPYDILCEFFVEQHIDPQ